MTTVRASCPKCGDVDMPPEAITIVSRDAGPGTYEFACPQCGYAVSKPTDERIIKLLMAAGVPTVRAEVREVATDKPPLTSDDLIEFHYELENDQLLAAFIEG